MLPHRDQSIWRFLSFMALLAHPVAGLPLQRIVPGAMARMAGYAGDHVSVLQRYPCIQSRTGPVKVFLVREFKINRVSCPWTAAAAVKLRMASGTELPEA